MESEKAKEIKKALERIVNPNASKIELNYYGNFHDDVLTLINELERENEKLKHLREVDYKKMISLRQLNNELNECMDEMQDQIAELEDKIERGTLLELPCKVGDTLWEAKKNYIGVWDIEVDKIEIFEYNDIRILDRYDNDYSVEDFGKTVFLTKAEAEKRLEELKND